MKKLMSMFLALALATGAMMTMADDAEARRGRGVGIGVGVAAGIIGLGILGAAANARPSYGYAPACYQGPRECSWGPGRCWYNRYGEQVCGRGEYRCYRRTICP